VFLQDLSEARGPSGNEKGVRSVLLGAIDGRVDEHRIDALGNLICLRKARRERAADTWPRSVLVTAHMDEVGLIVSGINADGTLRFGRVGGIDDRVLVARTVLIGEQAIPGVIGTSPIHLVSSEERNRAVDASHLVIDIGAANKAAAERLVQPGDYATFRVGYAQLDDEGLRTVKGKAFDDRAGCAVLVEILNEDYALDVWAAFTAQEEVGLRGARVAAYRVNPDVAIALEGTICDDLPKETDVSPVTQVGKGPAISFMDNSVIADSRLVGLLTQVAEEQGIPFQFKRAVAGGTDSGAIQLTREGIPAVTVAVPTRFIHAPASLLSLNDLDHTVALMKAALHALEKGLPR